MEPVRKVISATHFKPVRPPAGYGQLKWTSCSSVDSEAVEKSLDAVSSDELLIPPLQLADFHCALKNVHRTVSEEETQKHVHWKKESGTTFS